MTQPAIAIQIKDSNGLTRDEISFLLQDLEVDPINGADRAHWVYVTIHGATAAYTRLNALGVVTNQCEDEVAAPINYEAEAALTEALTSALEIYRAQVAQEDRDAELERHVAVTLNAYIAHGRSAEILKRVKAPETLVIPIRVGPNGEILYAQVESLRLKENGEEICTASEAAQILGKNWPILKVCEI